MSSAIAGRQRRATAGKRMTDLVGKALEDDAAFWTHDTWAEDDSGNDSFSDNDSEAKVDVFDSDFNDSESDREEEEAAAGAAAERELAREGKYSKKKGGYFEKGATKKKKIGRRVMGDGLNAGLVLNIPGQAITRPPIVVRPAVQPQPAQQAVSVRPTRRRKEAPELRTRRATSVTIEKKKPQLPAVSVAKRKRERFSQEQLLFEAANDTEPANHRWLLARKRTQDQKESESIAPKEKRNVVETFTSRRGALNTVHFWDMDHAPRIFATQDVPQRPEPVYCAITNNPARYKDPKTGLGYYDAAAFRELRRRHDAGELQNRSFCPESTNGELSAPTTKSSSNDHTNNHMNAERGKDSSNSDDNLQSSGSSEPIPAPNK